MQNQYKGEVCWKWVEVRVAGAFSALPLTMDVCVLSLPVLCLSGGNTLLLQCVPAKPSRTMVPYYLKQVDVHSEYVEYKIFFLTRNYLEARQSRWVELKVFVSPTSLPYNRK